MNKRARAISVVFIIVIIPSVMLIMKNKGKTLNGKDTDFAVEDTSAVTKIFIANKLGGKVTLERKEGQGWMVNDKYPARRDDIELLLETFKNVQVRYPAPANAQENLIKKMSAQSVKCEIYCKGELTRIWYIGNETQDLKGTFCLLQDPNAEKPFETVYVLEIPGFVGVITPRFFTAEENWREKRVLSLLPSQIKNVSLNMIGQPDSSFSIDVAGLHNFSVKTLSNKIIAPFDTLAVQQYLSYFMALYVEAWATNSTDHEIDSVKKTNYFIEISITDNNNKNEKFKFFHKKPLPKNEVIEGVKMPYDPENMFMKLRDDKEFARVGVYTWGKLFQSSSYFLPKRVKK
ncbi:MAG TPA: hypothetical protein VNZ49_12750 [Bacteroidia bacterium]|jgi:hypothetical protein|nr:hypothetical protein [Bacteroidia bacterium]